MYQSAKIAMIISVALSGMLLCTTGAEMVFFFVSPRHFALVYLIVPVHFLANLYNGISMLRLLRLFKQFENETGDLLETSNNLMAEMKRNQMVSYVWSLSAVGYSLVEAVDYFMRGDITNGVISLVVAVLIIWMSHKNNKGSRDAVKRLLGEKSRMLRDRLVQAQEGLKGPLPQGV